MEILDLLARAVAALEKAEAEYFITGSVGMGFYAEPRMTRDIDIVAEIQPGAIPALCAAFPVPEFYVSPEAAAQAQATGGQFNILHPASGLKVDVMACRPTPFNGLRMFRRRRIVLDTGLPVYVATPEDIIVMKLKYYKEGGSEKHLRDIASLLRVDLAVDTGYVGAWAEREGVRQEWEAVRRKVMPAG